MNPFKKKEPGYLEEIQDYYRELMSARMSHDQVYIDQRGMMWTNKSGCSIGDFHWTEIDELKSGQRLCFHENTKGHISCMVKEEFVKMLDLVRRGYHPFDSALG